MDGILIARQVVECWPRKDRKQKDRTSPVWGLRLPGLFSGGHGRTAEQCQQAFFFGLAGAEGTAYIHHPDDPAEEGVPGRWEQVAEATWRVPSSIDLEAEATQHWLFSLGNWTVYAAPGPVVTEWPDPFRTKPDPLIAWMVEQEMTFLVTSFHDDTDWLVAIPGRSPGL